MKLIKKTLNTNFIKKWMDKGINPIILSILNRRGFSENETLEFLSPLLENLPSPFIYKDIIKAIKRIEQAIKNKEKIIIFGDKDVDGTTSTIILLDYLKNLEADVEYVIPIHDEPFGLNREKFDLWKDKNYKLCITVDCGITNIEEIHTLKKMEIDTIIIDHHQPLLDLPEAYAIINPKNEKNIIFNNIAACGVIFFFIFGYNFFRSFFFDKKIALLFIKENLLNVIIYENMIKIEDFSLNDFKDFNKYNYDLYYFYSEQASDYKNSLSSLSDKNIKILKPFEKIYNASLINFLDDIEYKAGISLINNIFKKIKNFEKSLNKYLTLVMLGTIADLMPLINSNRILAYHGIKNIKKSNLKNLTKLIDKLHLNIDQLNSKEISWLICPILNSPGRMGDANLTINFLNNKDDDELIHKIININEERKIKGDHAYNYFLNEIKQNKSYYDDNLTFFHSNDIEMGITGITANKLSKISNCPTIVAAKHGSYYTGSIRGKTKYHFVDFLKKCANILIHFGGHKQAAGFRLHEKDLDNFKQFLVENSFLFSGKKDDEEINIDAEIPINYLEYELINILGELEPFGIDNPNPTLFTSGLHVTNFYRIGKEKQHLKIYFKTEKNPFIGLYWDKGEWFENIHSSSNEYDVAYKLETNRYNGQITLQMIILYLNKKGH